MNRVSTFGIQNAAIAAMGNQQAKIARTQNQLATGLKLNTAADDPVAAGIAVALDRAAAENLRQGANANLLNNRLTLAEVTLADVGDRVQRLRELTVQANSGIFNQETRKSLLAEVRGQFDALLAIANMPDGQGRYLFAGSQDATVPFIQNPSPLPGVPAVAASYTTPDILSFNFATVPAIATDSVASGAYTPAASTVPSDAFQFAIDGAIVSDRLVADATDINLDADIAAFIAASAGAYTKTGSVAAGDLVISRSDGQDLLITTTFSDGIGSAAAAAGGTSGGTFADPTFVGLHTGGTVADTSANRTFTVSGPGGTPMTVLLDTDVIDINGLLAAVQANPGLGASGVSVALSTSGNGLAFTAILAGTGAIVITGDDEFDVGGLVVAGTAPVPATPVVAYVGDQTVREIEVGAGNTLRDVDAGSEIFMRVGAGRVVARPVAGNTGTGVLSSNAFTDPSQFISDTYRIVFSEPAPGDIQYQVLDSSNAALVPPVAGAYVPGQAISFLGVQVTLTGTPAAGDAFTLGPQAGKSLFDTTRELITLLEMPDQPLSVKADLQNGYFTVLGDLQALGDHVIDVRAGFGGRMALIDKSGEQREAQLLATRDTLSGLRDLDYAEAISRLSQETTTLEAAQQSFLRMQSLSLFDRL